MTKTKSDLIDCVVERTGLSKHMAHIAVQTILDTLYDSIVRGERIELRGFGVFDLRPRKTGVGRNPKTGEVVPILPGKAVRFRPGKNMQEISKAPDTGLSAAD